MKKQKLINSFKIGILIFGIILFFTNCEANRDIIEESALEHQTPPILSEKISFKQSKHFSEINSEIKSIQTKFNKKQTSKAGQKETDSLKILTDEVLYVTYAGTHTYTFKVVRKNPIYLLENIVLHYNLRTKNYDEYLIQYKDLKEQDIKEISEGKLFKDSKKVIVTKLENGFFESHSSSNKGISTSKASEVICTTATSTVWVDCSQGVHNQGNIEDWYKCTAKVGPSAYQSTSTTCKVSGPLPEAIVEPSPSNGGGGGYDPDFVFYNPLPLELCSDTDVVDLNGNCLKPIDVAVSYIANCLSSSYSTTLSQNEISYLYSTTSSFGIKSYLENSGCSSESIAFVKEIIDSFMNGMEADSGISDFVDQQPVKIYMGTVSDFKALLDNSPRGVGKFKGSEAGNYLKSLGETKFNFNQMRPLPTQTGFFNTKKGRYIYTKKGGWIDMAHFMFYAGKAYGYKINNVTNPIGEAVQDGYKQEASDVIVAKHSAYSYEDLPSDKFGAEFAVNFFDINSSLTFSEQLANYLNNILNASSPNDAPNFNDTPDLDSKDTRPITNTTTTPIYTK